ncbi:MAG TPA: TonB family protein [Rhizomicrobium sp.]|jgi:TonB family protein
MVAEGCGTFVWPDGTRYVGGFRGGFFDGDATITYPDGARLTLTFSNGSGEANATYITAEGARITGPFHDVGRDLAHPHPPIDYPFWRALFGDEADVIVAVIVDENGAVRTAQLYRKIDSPSYTDAALDSVKQWRYLPATIGGKPIRMPYLIDIQFSQPR